MIQDLKKKLTKLLGPDHAAALHPTLLFIFQNSEHQTCWEADRAIQNCTKVSTLDVPQLEKKSSQKLLNEGLQFSDEFKQKKAASKDCFCP